MEDNSVSGDTRRYTMRKAYIDRMRIESLLGHIVDCDFLDGYCVHCGEVRVLEILSSQYRYDDLHVCPYSEI